MINSKWQIPRPGQGFDDKFPQWEHSTWQLPMEGDGNAWNWLSHYDTDATIFHNEENSKISSLRASSSLKGYREKSRARGTRKEMREEGAGKERECSSFPPPLEVSPLVHTFASQSKWRGCSQAITFLSIRLHSLFSDQVYVRNSDGKFELFTYQATSTMTPRLLLPAQPIRNI